MSGRVFVLRDDSHQLRVSVIFDFLLFSRSAERSEFLIESEAQSAESLADVARRRMQISVRVFIFIVCFLLLQVFGFFALILFILDGAFHLRMKVMNKA